MLYNEKEFYSLVKDTVKDGRKIKGYINAYNEFYKIFNSSEINGKLEFEKKIMGELERLIEEKYATNKVVRKNINKYKKLQTQYFLDSEILFLEVNDIMIKKKRSTYVEFSELFEQIKKCTCYEIFNIVVGNGELSAFFGKINYVLMKMEIEDLNVSSNRKNYEVMTIKKYPTSEKLRREVLKENSYICEVCNVVGFNKVDGSKYCEGHHFIPMNQQKNFLENLDQKCNLVCLCPTCHRKIHFSSERSKIIDKLLKERKIKISKILGKVASVDDIIKLYDKS